MRSVLYRFPDLLRFEQMVLAMEELEFELGLPSGEAVEDGEWVLAIFELGRGRRATSAAARASLAPDGARLVFELRDWKRLAEFAQTEARRPSLTASDNPPPAAESAAPVVDEATHAPETTKSRHDGAIGQTARVRAPAHTVPWGDLSSTPTSRAKRASEHPDPTSRAKRASEHPDPIRVTEDAGSGIRGAFGPQPTGAGARVLVVDDDPDIREVVSAMLEAVGLVVLSATSAEEALSRVRAERFDLLVLDWNLPKMTGIDLCRTIRREPGLMHVPVLFLTANASSQDMVDAFASGADDYVVKPFRAPELGARIFSLLRRGRILQG